MNEMRFGLPSLDEFAKLGYYDMPSVYRQALGRIAELERMLSECVQAHAQLEGVVEQAWVPVDDGRFTRDNAVVLVEESGTRIAVTQSDVKDRRIWLSVALPDDLRLCRRGGDA